MKRTPLAILGLFLLVYVVPLGVRPLYVPDETRYAEIPREMLASGDWIVPRLDGVRYFEKPVLGYWLGAASIGLLGENAFAARLPGALAVGLTALLLWLLATRSGMGGPVGARLAGIFLSCVGVFGIGTFNVLDNALSLFLTSSMLAFFCAHQAASPTGRYGLLALAGVASGLAFLTKGFIGFAVPAVAIVPFLIWEGRWKQLLGAGWIAVAAACLVALPWARSIQVREPDFWHFFFWNEHIRRFASDAAQHPRSVFYFFGIFAGLAMPWTFLLPALLSGMKRMDRGDPAVRYALCWLVFPFLFFSMSRGKLATYVLPCLPPFAFLVEVGLRRYFEAGNTRAFRIGAYALATALGVVALALLLIQGLDLPSLRLCADAWKAVLVCAGLSSMAALLVLAARATRHSAKLALYAASPALCFAIAPFAVPHFAITHKSPGDLLLSHAQRVRPESILVSDRSAVSAVCWYYRRSDVRLLEGAGELSYGMSYENSQQRVLGLDELKELILRHRGTSRVTLFEQAKRYERQKEELPAPIFADSSGEDGFVFVQF